MKYKYIYILILIIILISGFFAFKESTQNLLLATDSKDAISTSEEWNEGTANNLIVNNGSVVINDRTGGDELIDLTGGTVVASPDESKMAVVDDLVLPEWIFYFRAGFWEIDVGEAISVGKLRLQSLCMDGNYDVLIYSSDNGTDWDLVSRYTVPTIDWGLSYIFELTTDPLPIKKRYWRIAGTEENIEGTTAIDYLRLYTPSPYATHTTAPTQIDGQEGSADKKVIEWTSFTPTQTTPANTSISYEFRTSDDGSNWTSWSAPQAYSGSPLDLTTLTPNRYLQVRATLSTTDALATPQIDDYTVNFHNNQKPNKPTAQTVTFD